MRDGSELPEPIRPSGITTTDDDDDDDDDASDDFFDGEAEKVDADR